MLSHRPSLASHGSSNSGRRTLACVGVGLSLALGACKATEPAPTQEKPTAESAAKSTPSPAPAPSPTADAKGPTGSVRVLSADASVLARPTTAAFRGETLYVAIGQLSALFTDGAKPTLPFTAVPVAYPAGSIGAERITLAGDDYYPEGITAAADGTLYIGSIMTGVISKVPAGSTQAAPFLAKGKAKRGVIGLTVDAKRDLLWFCDSNPKLEEAKKAGELVGVKLGDASEVVRHALPQNSEGKPPFCNDVIVSPDGTLWITETPGGRLFRVAADGALTPNSVELWASGGELAPPGPNGSGPNGLEWVNGKLIVANSGRGTLVELDPTSTAPDRGARTLTLTDAETKAPVKLCSPDGLDLAPGSMNAVVVVENGGCDAKTPRLSVVTIETSG